MRHAIDHTGQRSLLIGCGHSRAKKIQWDGNAEWAGVLTTMDISPDVGADMVFDMEAVAQGGVMPFPNDWFDEVSAFDTQEHWGKQGDWRGWFWEMGQIHRILKPGGLFFSLVPIGADALADPGHTRFFSANWFNFLCEEFYEQSLAAGAPITDYRWALNYRFKMRYCEEQGGHHLAVILEKA